MRSSRARRCSWCGPIRSASRSARLIRDREIVLEDAVPLPAARTCLRYLGGVDLLKLGEMACHHRQVPDLYEAYCRTQTPVSLPHLLGGLSLLVANGVLTHRLADPRFCRRTNLSLAKVEMTSLTPGLGDRHDARRSGFARWRSSALAADSLLFARHASGDSFVDRLLQ